MIREPAVAGRFYPANPRELKHQIEQLLGEAVAAPKLRALGCVVPHAGYMYSGPVASSAYACLAHGRNRLKRVVLLAATRLRNYNHW